MKDILLMTPGPTYVHESVRHAMSKPITNPDLDPDFFEFYKSTCHQFQKLLKTKNDVLILNGEGILGLEAAVASLVEPGDSVLCIDNGLFGHGFGDFLKMYGAEVTYYESDYKGDIDVEKLKEFLEENHDFKLATLVHCETPSGITNPVNKICPLLKQYDVLSLVDSVSAMAGEPLEVDQWQMDVVLGGSQKCLSAPPGLTIISISDGAWKTILGRKIPVRGHYCNLGLWKTWYEDHWFPYTQPISDLYGIRAAVERVLDSNDYVSRHKKNAEGVRYAFKKAGLSLHAHQGHSNTVTTINIPEGLLFQDIFSSMLEDHQIMIAGAFGYLKDKVIRIGHMGENCYEEKIYVTLKALDITFKKHMVDLKGKLHQWYQEFMDS
jgi:aspartate aminotransferase-like enzyme